MPGLIISDNNRSFWYLVNIGSSVHKGVFLRFISFILNRERRAGDFMPRYLRFNAINTPAI